MGKQKIFLVLFLLATIDVEQVILELVVSIEFIWAGPAAPFIGGFATLPLSFISMIIFLIAFTTSHVGLKSLFMAKEKRMQRVMITNAILILFEFSGGFAFIPGWTLSAFRLYRAVNKMDKKRFKKAQREFKKDGVVKKYKPHRS